MTYAHEMVAPAYECLLRELLLCLSGFSGDVFIDETPGTPGKKQGPQQNPEPQKPRLAEDISWVEEPDRVILEELAQLGYYFRTVSSFIEQEGSLGNFTTAPGTIGGSMYCRALTGGLQELLDVYEAKLLEIQELILGLQAPVLPRLQYLLSDFQVLLPEAHQLVCDVQRLRLKDFKGSELIALLHARVHGGGPVLQSCMQRLLWHCNQVLIKQLSSWMVHGLLIDEFKESFIALPEQNQQQQAQAARGSGVLHDDWHAGCQVKLAALPLYISPEVADTILFVGKAVRLLKHPTGAFAGQELLSNSDTLEFVEALRKLQLKDTFQRVEFEHTVEGIRAKVAAVLWQLVVVQADLMGHLSAIKDYFLLAKGDFYHTFLVEAHSLMSMPPRPSFADADVSIPFQHSALKSTAQHDRLFHLFRMRWSKEEAKGEAQKLDNWDTLYLEYQVEWPMGLLFTPPVIARYNMLFQFLMRLKRVQLKLEHAWQSLHALFTHDGRRPIGSSARRMAGFEEARDAAGPEGNVRLKQLHLLRHHMAHLIANLQIYIQVDVIESSYKVLEDRIASAHDFAEAERAHANYLHAVVNQCFLNTGTITRAIGAVFKQVQELCNMVDVYVRAVGAGHSPAESQAALTGLASLHASFSQSVNHLSMHLQSSRLQDANKAPHLRQLYLRLNFNSYVGKNMTQGVIPYD